MILDSYHRLGILSALRCNEARKEVNDSGLYGPGLPIPVTAGYDLRRFTAMRVILCCTPALSNIRSSGDKIMSEMNRILARVRKDVRCSSCPLVHSVPLKHSEFSAVTAITLLGLRCGLSDADIDYMLEIFFEARDIFVPEEVKDA